MVLKVKSARVVLLAMFIAYTTAWSYITIMRYLAMNANVFDLGLFMEYGWWVLHEVHTFYSFLYWFSYNGIIYVVSPITLLESYPAVLIFQSALIGFAVFPLYGIAKYYLKDELSSLLIAASYLLYFPLAGVNWFDAHYQALFPTLFLLGYYFYIREKKVASFVFMALSAITHYPYTVFVLMFAIMLLLQKKRDVKLALPLIIFTLFIFVLNFIFYGATGATLGTVAAAPGSPSLLLNLLTLFLILAPLLFLPLLSRKWVVFLIPYIALIFISNYEFYRTPLLFMYQYPALFVAFVFLGTVDAIALLSGARVRRSRVISAMLLITVVIFAVAYEPYGPLNQYTSINYSILGYNMHSIENVNWQRYYGLLRTISLLPKNTTVAVQNNMPEIYPTDSTVYDIGFFPHNISTAIKFLIADPFSFSFSGEMYNLFEKLWNSGNYGLVSEAAGIVMIERNYTGNIKYYYPLDMNYSASQLAVTGSASRVNGYIKSSNVRNAKLWFGPWTSIVPGLYSVTFYLKGNASGTMDLLVTANDWGKVLGSRTINLSSLGRGWKAVTYTFYVNNIYQQVEFIGYANDINGTLLFKGVSLEQIAPGLPNAHDIYVFPDELYAGPGAKVSNDVLTVFNASNTIAWYGPYVNLYPGTYIAKYSLSTTNSSPYNRAMLQVTADNGKVILGEQGITGADLNNMSYEIFTVNSTTQNVEFKGYVQRWNGNLSLYSIRVMTAKPIFNVTYPAYGLYSNLYANGDIILNANNTFFYGPYVNLPAGNYSVTFILQGQAELNLQVTSNFGSDYLAEKTVSVNGLSIVTINFSISSEAQYVEFRGYLIKGSAELMEVRCIR